MAKNTHLKRTVLKISGMHCAGCVSSIQGSVSRIRGVSKCDVNLASEKASIEYDPIMTNLQGIEDSITRIGYKVVYQDAILFLRGLTDSADAQRLESELGKLEGVRHVEVNYGNSSVHIRYNPALISLTDFKQKISSYHYEIVSEDLATSENTEYLQMKRYFLISLVFTVPVIFFSYPEIFKFVPLSATDLSVYIMLACAAFVQFITGSRFYLGAYRIAKMGSANMDTLVVVGTTSAYLFSVFNTFPQPNWQHLSYDASSVVITFILLGKYLENKTKGRASETIRKLLELQPRTTLLRRDDKEIEVPIENIQVNDIIVVKSGSKIPVDGIVIDGNSAVDESMITGESLPVRKRSNDLVIGGTINREGTLVMRATRVGRDTLISQIAKMVEDAVSKKPPLQRLVDVVAGKFAFTVMAIATATFLVWFLVLSPSNLHQAVIPAVAIMVVACPCALGLATPTAIMVGIGRGAQNGILFKGSHVLESLKKVNVVVFDKTGTLTYGQPAITEIVSLSNISESDIIRFAASVERYSEHPIAKSILMKSTQLGLTLHETVDSVTLPGLGVVAKIGGNEISVGSIQMMKQNGVSLTTAMPIIQKMQDEAKTVVLLAINSKVAGIIDLQDIPRPEAMQMISILKARNLQTIMVTGDNERTANSLAAKIGIEKVIANVLPSKKMEIIQDLQKQNNVVMIGDGINDAPALTQADVGIAIGSGTDIAIEAGNVILVKNNLFDIINAFDLAGRTVRKIKENLFYAFAYNAILIPLAALGLLYPALAGAAMAASSVSVTTSSLLLKRWKPRYYQHESTHLHN